MPPLPDDLQALYDAYDAIDREAARLVATVTAGQLDWQPRGGRAWSMGQCLDHMVATNRVYLPPVEDAVAGAVARSDRPRRGALVLPWFGRWFVSQLAPPPRRRLPAPKKVLPAIRVDGGEVLAQLRATHDRARAVLARAAPIDVNRVRFANPFIPGVRFTVGTAFAILAAHGRRHLWQAAQLAADTDWPA
jgi:hypothetical protein